MKVQNSPLCPSEISGKTCTSLECVGWQPEHIWGSQFVAQVKEALKEKVGYLQRFSFPRHLNTAIKWWPWRTLSSPHGVALPAVQCWSTCAESLSGSLFSDTPWHCPLWQWLPGCFLFQNSACLLIFINKYQGMAQGSCDDLTTGHLHWDGLTSKTAGLCWKDGVSQTK